MATKIPSFDYSGSWRTELKNGYWHIYLLTSGRLKMSHAKTADVFLVGGGGGGGGGAPADGYGGSGGGGGYTKTYRNVAIAAFTEHEIVIGAGGAPNERGGTSSAFDCEAEGGYPGTGTVNGVGGDGGSGGGGLSTGPDHTDHGGDGGSDGSDGVIADQKCNAGGKGQGTTTRAFGEDAYPLYAGGGGGMANYPGNGGEGGEGGGGRGGSRYVNASTWTAATDGEANTGGGGGGGPESDAALIHTGRGGSGIVIIRGTQDDILPVRFDGTALQYMRMNGRDVKHFIYNGTQIFMERFARRRCLV